MTQESPQIVLETIGNYDLLVKIAEGGMGTIYKARNRQTGQIVAIKIVPANLARNAVLLKRFEQEFRAASMLDHPNIVRALDYCGFGDRPFLVMEFVDGESLGQKIDREGLMPEDQAIQVIAQAAQGLHRAHKQGLIHRDVKPDNIMLDRDGVAKLTDLGLVKEVDAELNLTRTGRGLGTPYFMAPEQFRNAKNADARCDIYSLGATLYMLVTGKLPFENCNPVDAWMRKNNNDLPTPRQLNPKLSERTDWAIRRSMSADPDRRPASCREFIEDLLGHSVRKTPSDQAEPDLWYLNHADAAGQAHTVRDTTANLRQALRAKQYGDLVTIRVSRSENGPFEALQVPPEFRDLVIEPAAMPPGGARPAPKPPPPAATGSVDSASSATSWVARTPPTTSPPAPPQPSVTESGRSLHVPLDVERTSNAAPILQWLAFFILAGGSAFIAWYLLKPR